MKQRILLIGFVLIQFVALNVKGQIVFSKNDTLNIQKDSLVLKANYQRGDVIWQFSKTLDEWSDLPNGNRDSLVFHSIDSSGYYRAKVVDGTCEPVFSDTTYVLRALTDSIINAILSESTNVENKITMFDSDNDNSEITFIDTSSVNPIVQIITTELPDTIQPGWLIVDTTGVGRIFMVTDFTIQKSGGDFITKVIDGIQVGIDFLITDQTLSYSSPSNRTKLEWNSPLKLDNTGKLKGKITYNLEDGERNINVSNANDLLALNFSKKELWNLNTGTTTLRFWLESGTISLRPALDFYAEYVPVVVATKLLSPFLIFNPFKQTPEYTTKGLLNDLKLITYCDLDLDLQLKFEASIHEDISDKVKPVKLVEYFYSIPAGPIFVTVKTELFARLILEATGEISVNPKVEWDNNIVLGVVSQKVGDQYENEFISSYTDKKNISSSIEGNFNFRQRVEIVPKIEVYVMGLVGLRAETIPYQEFTFNASITDTSPLIYDYSFDLGIDARTTFDLSAFHWDNATLSLIKKDLQILAKKNVFSAPYSLEYISGNDQTGAPRQLLSEPIAVKVTNSSGNIMKNYPVFYDVVSGGGGYQSNYSLSNSNGVSNNYWQLGASGVQTSRAYLKKANHQIVDRSVLDFNASVKENNLPTLTTAAITSITQTAATSGGNITSDGGAAVTARGVCWSTSQNPTTANSKTTNGTGTGSFTSNLTGLTANTPYFLRAYATNSKGTAYGNEVTFTTGQEIGLPVLTTTAITEITETTATNGGNIASDGGAAVTARGVCWSTSPNPTTANSKTTNGTGTGSFTSNLTGLTANTLYYVRAYATNSAGTAYGNEVTFTTTAAEGPVYGSFTDPRDGHVYKTVKIGTQVWMAENLAYLPTGSLVAGCSVYGYNGTSEEIAKATSNYKIYGVLYKWDVANVSCPQGWHLPSEAEWIQMEQTLGLSIEESSEAIVGCRGTHGIIMKSTSGWYQNGNGTNSSGFNALPSGHKETGFYGVGKYCTWWSFNSIDSFALTRSLEYDRNCVNNLGSYKFNYYSVRCLKD